MMKSSICNVILIENLFIDFFAYKREQISSQKHQYISQLSNHMETTSKINVLIVGATGKLGSLITKHCLTKSNLITNILVRDPQKNKDLASQVEKAGGRVIKGDITQPKTIKGVTKGMQTVVLAISAERQVIVEGQKAVIDDSVANGVARIIPTEYGFNFHQSSPKELEKLPFLSQKVEIMDYLKTKPLKVLTIGVGIFVESLYGFFFDSGFNYWGDENLKIQTTSYENSARFVAAVVSRPELEGPLAYVGHDLSVARIAEIYNQVREASLEVKRVGSLEDLRKQAAEAEKKGDPSAWGLWFLSLVFDERARFEKVDNQDFPEVQPTSIEEVLREKPEVQAGKKFFMKFNWDSIL